MLTLHLTPIFKARGIDRPHAFLVKSGISSHSANKILFGTMRVVRLDHLEKLCSILNCDPNDMLIWLPDRGKTYPDNHALLRLQPKEKRSSIHDAMASMSFKELQEFTKSILKP